MLNGVIEREKEPVTIGEVLHRLAVHRLECAHVRQDMLNARGRVDRLAVWHGLYGRWERIILPEDALVVEVLLHFLRCDKGEAAAARWRL